MDANARSAEAMHEMAEKGQNADEPHSCRRRRDPRSERQTRTAAPSEAADPHNNAATDELRAWVLECCPKDHKTPTPASSSLKSRWRHRGASGTSVITMSM